FDPSTISGFADVKQSIFTVYPNPSNGVFTIELDATEKHDITVNNALGQTVISTTNRGMNTTIDLSNFGKGVYTVELKNNSSTYVEKVIVE
ncbi:MAG: T9SS type A sorting domain-containing protein, partial [Flavobacteriales bacterium]|nr:T9SS type A sorting domain-containing protein [Flavobacteriales bacterium]